MTRIYLDSNAIIYLIEGNPVFHQAAVARLRALTKGAGAQFCTSRISRLECRVGPLKSKNVRDLARYDVFFRSLRLELLDVSEQIIDQAAELCAKYNLKSLDGVHIASALAQSATVFLTGDMRLKRCTELNVDVPAP